MTLPPTCTVTGAWLNPDETAATGQVVITPVASATGSTYIVVARPVTVELVAGAISVIVANNSGFPSLQYRISEQIDGTSTVDYIVTPTGSSVDLQTAPRSTTATAATFVLASTVGQPNGVASLDGTGKVPVAQIPGGSGGGVTLTSPDGTITVGGTDSAPTVDVAAIIQSQVTGLPAALTANATAISAETTRAEAAEALLAPLVSPALTGTPTVPTKPALTDSTAAASTAYADAAVAVETGRAETAEAGLYTKPGGGIPSTDLTSGVQTDLGLAVTAVQSVTAADGTVVTAGTGTAPTVRVGTISESQVTGLASDLASKAPLASPALTGAPTAPTAAALTNSTRLATTAYTDTAVAVETSRAEAAEATKLAAASNLADVASAPTALGNLGGVPTARTLTAGTGLTGGGDLTANRTLTVAYGTTAGTAAQGNDTRLGLAASAVQSVTAADGTITVAGTSTAPTVAVGVVSETQVTGLTADLAARLVAASNLSDLTNAGTARTNLGLGSAATQASSAFDTAGAAATRQLLYASVATQTGTYTASVGQLVPCNATSGSFTVTLPTGAGAGGQVIVKLLATAGTNTVTVAAGGSDVINLAGTTSATLQLASESFELTSNGSGTWFLSGGQKSLSSLDTRYGLTFNVVNYGAKRNYATSTTGAMTASSAVLTDTNAAFTSANVGQYVTVVGAGAAGVDLSTTIASVGSGTQVTLTVAASTTVSAATYAYGTSDTVAIQAAITAAGAVGGTVFFPPGGYVLGTAIVPANNISMMGAGIGATVLWPFGTVSAVQLQASSGSPLTNFTLAHLTIDGARQAGAYSVSIKGIFTQYSAHMTLEDLVVQNCIATGIGTDFLTQGSVIHNCRAIGNGRTNQGGGSGSGSNGIGIGVGQHTVEDWVVSDCYASGNGRYGIMMESQTGTTSYGMRITNCYATANFNHGFGDAGGNGAVWTGCISYANVDDGFSIDNGTVGATAQPGGNSLYVGCAAISNSRYGFSYQPTASNSTSVAGAGNHTYSGCKAYGNTSLGFNINSVASHPVSGMTYLGCEAYSNGASGLEVQQVSNDIKISNCKLNANGQTSGSSKYGVMLNVSVTGLQIADCRAWDDGGTQKQAYGLYIASGTTVTNGHIANNDLRGNLTGAVSQLGTLTSCYLDNNVGYAPASRSAGPRSSVSLPGDTVTNWLTNNPTLNLGEIGYETDTRQVKIGDGATAYATLGYAAPAYLDQLAAAAVAAVAVTMDPMNSQGSPGITTGRPYFCLAHIAAYQTISAMDIDIVAVGATTTVSTTFMGIYDVALGTLLGQTADFSSTLTAGLGTTLLKVNLASTIAAQNIGRPVYLSFLSTLTGSGASLTVIGGRQFGSNQSAASPNGRLFTNSSGSTMTSLPGTVPALVQTGSYSMPYLGAYH